MQQSIQHQAMAWLVNLKMRRRGKAATAGHQATAGGY